MANYGMACEFARKLETLISLSGLPLADFASEADLPLRRLVELRTGRGTMATPEERRNCWFAANWRLANKWIEREAIESVI